jgi:ABC-2 type transport system ATP-binding protein
VSGGLPPAVTVQGLTKAFEGTTVVDRVAFSVDRGEIFGVVGPDGCGKTTILRMLAGVMAADNGTIEVGGIDGRAEPERIKSHLSYMPQRFGLYEDLTVDENIRFYADIFEVPKTVRDERAARLLAASGMTRFRGFLAGQLSGGMKQKLGLTCALVHTPKLLLLDEPTTGVDPLSRREFWGILYDLRETGVTIVISTAYLDEAERCNRLALLHKGKLLYCDTPEALKQRMPGALLAISSTDGRAARRAIASRPGVSHTLLVGDGLHAVVDDAAVRIPELRHALDQAAVPVRSIAQVKPAIEDVFVALLESDGQNE